MAYTTPATSTAGTALTASFLNTYVRDNVAWMATDSPACRAFNSGVVSVTNNAETLLTYDSERFDNAAVHSTSVNTGRMTVPTGGAGKYAVGYIVTFAASAAGVREAYVRQNGTLKIGGGGIPITNGNFAQGMGFTVYVMAVADYFDTSAFQNSGGPLNTVAPSASQLMVEFFCFWFRT